MAFASVKPVQFHASERVDREDLLGSTQEYADAVRRELGQQIFIDKRSRIVRGFRIELPDQGTYPGRVIVHAGAAVDSDGRIVFNSDQPEVTRSITLEGSNTTFYLEIEFVEVDSDLDARAFWDPTVDQGTDPSGDEKPDGQEFSNNVATRKIKDWRIVQPVSTSGFTRDQVGTIDSNKIPLVKLSTDASNQIVTGVNPGLATEKASTVLLRQISDTQLLVQNPQELPPSTVDLTVSVGKAAEETVTVTSVDRETGLVVVTTMSNNHEPGAIIRGSGSTAANFITQANYGPYRREDESNPIDFRDKFWQGDEVHGRVLSQGHDSTTDRSDVNVQNLKDYVDFLASQIYQLKWGAPTPYIQGDAEERFPLGVGSSLPAVTRYFDNAGSIQGAKSALVTIGDGTNSFGDLIGTTHEVFSTILQQTPFNGGSGGTIYVKPGTYTFDGIVDFTSTTSSNIKIVFDPAARIITNSGGYFRIADDDVTVSFDSLVAERGTGDVALLVSAANPRPLRMHECVFSDTAFVATTDLDKDSVFRDCAFLGVSGLTGYSPVDITGIARGKFYNVRFQNTANTDPAFDATNTEKLEFLSCELGQVSGNYAMVLGNTTFRNHVRFRDCIVDTQAAVAALSTTYVRDVVVTGTTMEGSEKLLEATLCTGIVVEGSDRDSQTSENGLAKFIGCSHVTVARNRFNLYQATPSELALKGLEFSAYASSSSMVNIRCSSNQIQSFSQNNIAVYIDQNFSNTTYDAVHLEDNEIDGMEIGILIHRSGGTGGDLVHINITGNLISARDYATTVPKVGIWSTQTLYNSNISENTIRDFLASDSTEFASITGSSRHGILLSNGAIAYRTSIVNNTIREIGNASFITNVGAAIECGGSNQSVIIGNTIDTLTGDSAYGIQTADGDSDTVYSTCANNTIVNVVARGTNGTVYGIRNGRNSWYSTITGNVIHSLQSLSSITDPNLDQSSGIWCGRRGNSSNYIRNLVIMNNNIYLIGYTGSGRLIHGIRCEGRYLNQIAIDHNVIRGSTAIGYGIVIRNNTATATAAEQWSVTGNQIFYSYNGSLVFLEHTGSNAYYVTVCSNNARTYGDSEDWYGFWLNGLQYFSCTGNVVYETANPVSYGADALYFTNCDIFTCVANALRVTTQTCIDVEGGGRCLIVANICHKGGYTDQAPIDMSNNTSRFLVGGNMLEKLGIVGAGSSLDARFLQLSTDSANAGHIYNP